MNTHAKNPTDLLETKYRIKRVYDPVSNSDGTRLLVERLWPRGVKKTSLEIKAWLKDVAPSTELRKWFSHDPTKWNDFCSRYLAELQANPDAWRPIIEATRHGPVTLIYSSMTPSTTMPLRSETS